MEKSVERIRVLTFPELQAKRRRKSLLIFVILSAYYILSILFLTWIGKLFLIWLDPGSFKYFPLLESDEIPSREFILFFPLSSSGYLWLSLKQALTAALFALGVAGIHWAFSMAGALRRIEAALGTQEPDPEDRYHRVFQNIVEEMMISSGVKNVRPVILPSLSVNAFAAGDLQGRSIIGVTEGLLSRMDRPQLEGVVAHEMSHIAEGDHVINSIVCALLAVYARLFELSSMMFNSGTRVFAGYNRMRTRGRFLTLPFAVAGWMAALWLVRLGGLFLRMAISREREFLADATAVQFTRNPLGLAEALYKISRSWKGVGDVSEELGPLFFVNPDEKGLNEKEGLIADLFSTHPPVRKRIFSLLNQARTPLSVLRKKLEETQEIKEEAKEIENIPRWMINRDGKWEGPFGVGDLTGFQWFTPSTWISLDGNAELKKASEEPLLSNLFQSRLPSASPQSQLSMEGKTLCCPRCKQELRESDYEGVDVFHCIFCKGILVRNELIPRILAREEKGFTPAQKKWAELWESKMQSRPQIPGTDVDPHLPCPKCQRNMIRNFYSYQYFIPVDRCLGCKWIWFDNEELSLLQMLVEKRKSSVVSV